MSIWWVDSKRMLRDLGGVGVWAPADTPPPRPRTPPPQIRKRFLRAKTQIMKIGWTCVQPRTPPPPLLLSNGLVVGIW